MREVIFEKMLDHSPIKEMDKIGINEVTYKKLSQTSNYPKS